MQIFASFSFYFYFYFDHSRPFQMGLGKIWETTNKLSLAWITDSQVQLGMLLESNILHDQTQIILTIILAFETSGLVVILSSHQWSIQQR